MVQPIDHFILEHQTHDNWKLKFNLDLKAKYWVHLIDHCKMHSAWDALKACPLLIVTCTILEVSCTVQFYSLPGHMSCPATLDHHWVETSPCPDCLVPACPRPPPPGPGSPCCRRLEVWDHCLRVRMHSEVHSWHSSPCNTCAVNISFYQFLWSTLQ